MQLKTKLKKKKKIVFRKYSILEFPTVIRTYFKRKGREVCDNKKCEGIAIIIIYVIFHLYVALYQVR